MTGQIFNWPLNAFPNRHLNSHPCPLALGAFWVPAEAYTPGPPSFAALLGEGRWTENERQTAEKKTNMKNPLESLTEEKSGLRSRSEKQGAGEAAKYIVIVWNRKEQVITFPFHVQHSAILDYIRHETPPVQVISAGFFIADGDAWWVGDRSETLDVDSRPEDTAAPIDIAGLA